MRLRLRLVSHLQRSLKIWSFGQWVTSYLHPYRSFRFDHIAKVHRSWLKLTWCNVQFSLAYMGTQSRSATMPTSSTCTAQGSEEAITQASPTPMSSSCAPDSRKAPIRQASAPGHFDQCGRVARHQPAQQQRQRRVQRGQETGVGHRRVLDAGLRCSAPRRSSAARRRPLIFSASLPRSTVAPGRAARARSAAARPARRTRKRMPMNIVGAGRPASAGLGDEGRAPDHRDEGQQQVGLDAGSWGGVSGDLDARAGWHGRVSLLRLAGRLAARRRGAQEELGHQLLR